MARVAPPRRLGTPEPEAVELELGAIAESQRAQIVSYLQGAEALVAGGYWTDPVTEDPEDSIPFALMTDGEYVWSSPWAFLVGRYGAALPDEFMRHMSSKNFQAPELSEEVVYEIGVREGIIPSDEFWAALEAGDAEQNGH